MGMYWVLFCWVGGWGAYEISGISGQLQGWDTTDSYWKYGVSSWVVARII